MSKTCEKIQKSANVQVKKAHDWYGKHIAKYILNTNIPFGKWTETINANDENKSLNN